MYGLYILKIIVLHIIFKIEIITIFSDDQVPALIEYEVSPKEFRKNWERLIQ